MKKFIVGALLAAALSGPANAAELLIANGKLTGATGVNVNGLLFNVSFVEGTCAELFTGCDDASDFAFNTFADGTLAANALLDQVFINLPSGADLLRSFDSQPELTFGCENTSSCTAIIPIGVGVEGFTAFTALNTQSVDDLFSGGIGGVDPVLFNTTTSPTNVFARFVQTQAIPAVPEPGTWAMMLLGFGFVGGAMRSAKRRQKLTVYYA